jgi:hypothetical protein
MFANIKNGLFLDEQMLEHRVIPSPPHKNYSVIKYVITHNEYLYK